MDDNLNSQDQTSPVVPNPTVANNNPDLTNLNTTNSFNSNGSPTAVNTDPIQNSATASLNSVQTPPIEQSVSNPMEVNEPANQVTDSGMVPPVVPSSDGVNGSKDNEPKKGKSGLLKTIVIMILMFLVGAGIAVAFILFLNKDEDIDNDMNNDQNNNQDLVIDDENNEQDVVEDTEDGVDTDVADWKKYENDEYGISLSYPRDWVIDDSEIDPSDGEMILTVSKSDYTLIYSSYAVSDSEQCIYEMEEDPGASIRFNETYTEFSKDFTNYRRGSYFNKSESQYEYTICGTTKTDNTFFVTVLYDFNGFVNYNTPIENADEIMLETMDQIFLSLEVDSK
jgi:hypothetical protein